MRRPVALLIAILVISVSFGASVAAQSENKTSQPNVLFIAIDDLKPLLGCYGHENVISPSIDRLAAESTVFINAHCQFPVCGGSRASLMTGLRPEATGVMDLKTSMRAKNPNVVTLPQHFKRNGYATTGVGKIYDPRCVDDKKTNDAPSWSIPFSQLPYSKLKFGGAKQVVLAPEVDEAELTDGYIARQGVKLLRQLSKKSDKPFFLAVGFKKPHLPFIAPKKYWDLYQEDEIQLAEHRGGIENASGYSIHDSSEFRGYEGVPKSGAISETLQRKSIHGYLACISFIDAQVGLLLDELETLGLKDKTIVVLWGDHGFHLGDHGMWGKHTTLEHAARVPLIIRTPAGKSIAQSDAPVELVDMFPTISELADLKLPSSINGRSLVPIMTENAQQVREGALTVFKSKGSIGYSFRTQRYRYTEWVNKNLKTVARELYDYESDPLEKVNLASRAEHADLQAKLAKQLRAHSQGCERLIGNSVPIPTGKRLRELSPAEGSNPLLIGAASNAKFWGTESNFILDREFAYVTPGNDFKQSAIHPEPEKWKWNVADEWVKRCKQNGQLMRLHSAISPQCSHWAKDDARTGAELKQNLQEYVTEVCKRYNDQPHVRWMDVVNETVSRDGTWFGPREGNDRWENPWYQIGVDESHPLKPPVYVKLAFELANKHAPNIKQIVNQHGGMEQAMWEKVQAMIVYLQDQGLRVDGVGWQAHIDSGFENDPENVRMLRSIIEWAQSRKLEFHITECNVWIRKGKGEKINQADLDAQAKTYRELIRILRDYSEQGVVTWCAWQIRDNETERGQLKGCLFEADGSAKPAYFAIQSEAESILAEHHP